METTQNRPPDTAEPPDGGHPGGFVLPPGGGGAGTGEPRAVWLRAALLLAALVLLYAAMGVGGLVIVGALVVSIVLHEFGHYWTAKRAGMKVTEFFMGFGPRIWSFRRGETEYGVKLIPAGAYVRIIGMSNLEEVEPADEDRTYRSKGYWRRLSVVLAGPAMNLLIGLVLFTAVFATQGKPDDTNWTLQAIVPGSAADQAGLQVGDRIRALDGRAVGTFEEFVKEIEQRPGGPVSITYERAGERSDKNFELTWKLAESGAAAIPSNPPLVEGDRIMSVDGTPVRSYEDLRRALSEAPEGSVTVRVERAGDEYDLAVTTPLVLPVDGAKGFMGIRPETEIVDQNVVQAAGTALSESARLSVATLGGLGKVFNPANLGSLMSQAVTGQSPDIPVDAPKLTPVAGNEPVFAMPTPSEKARPVSIVGMVQFGSKAADDGWVTFALVIASINVLLALFNLLPLPPLDGGHALVATYEAIRGLIAHRQYRVDMTKLLPVTYAVVGLLLVVGITTITLDIRNPLNFGP